MPLSFCLGAILARSLSLSISLVKLWRICSLSLSFLSLSLSTLLCSMLCSSETASFADQDRTDQEHVLQCLDVSVPSIVFKAENLCGPTGEIIAPYVCIAVACDTDFGRQHLHLLGVGEQERYINSSSGKQTKFTRERKMLKEKIQLLEKKITSLEVNVNVLQATMKAMAEEQEGTVKALEADREATVKALEAAANKVSNQFAVEQALRMEAVQQLDRHQETLEFKVDENNGLVAAVINLSTSLKDLQGMRPVAMRNFCEIARWKIHRFLGIQGCQEPWLDRGWKYEGWSRMMFGIEQSAHWRELLLAHGLSMDAVQLLGYGPGSLLNRGSTAAHAEIDESNDLDVTEAMPYVKAYAQCISVQKIEVRKHLNSLFEFCFSAGDYLRHI